MVCFSRVNAATSPVSPIGVLVMMSVPLIARWKFTSANACIGQRYRRSRSLVIATLSCDFFLELEAPNVRLEGRALQPSQSYACCDES